LTKKISKILAFLRKLLLVFAKIVIITLVIEKSTNFFAENWPKSQKIVIITSTPGHTDARVRPLLPSPHKFKISIALEKESQPKEKIFHQVEASAGYDPV
jgi:hypothetical protein